MCPCACKGETGPPRAAHLAKCSRQQRQHAVLSRARHPQRHCPACTVLQLVGSRGPAALGAVFASLCRRKPSSPPPSAGSHKKDRIAEDRSRLRERERERARGAACQILAARERPRAGDGQDKARQRGYRNASPALAAASGRRAQRRDLRPGRFLFLFPPPAGFPPPSSTWRSGRLPARPRTGRGNVPRAAGGAGRGRAGPGAPPPGPPRLRGVRAVTRGAVRGFKARPRPQRAAGAAGGRGECGAGGARLLPCLAGRRSSERGPSLRPARRPPFLPPFLPPPGWFSAPSGPAAPLGGAGPSAPAPRLPVSPVPSAPPLCLPWLCVWSS